MFQNKQSLVCIGQKFKTMAPIHAKIYVGPLPFQRDIFIDLKLKFLKCGSIARRFREINFIFYFSVNSTGNGAAVPNKLPLDGDISSSNQRSVIRDRILSPPSINRMSLGSSHVVASTTITNLDSASQKFKLVRTF